MLSKSTTKRSKKEMVELKKEVERRWRRGTGFYWNFRRVFLFIGYLLERLYKDRAERESYTELKNTLKYSQRISNLKQYTESSTWEGNSKRIRNPLKMAHFALLIKGKLSRLSKQNRMVAEKRIIDIVFEIIMSAFKKINTKVRVLLVVSQLSC